MSKIQITLLLDPEVVSTLDAICAPYDRSRASVMKEMVMRHDEFLKAVIVASAPRSAPATAKVKEPKPEPPKPAGADGVLVYMQSNNTATQPLGSRWLLKMPESLPPLELLPWALRPPEKCERVKVSKTCPSGVKYTCPLPVSKVPPTGPIVPHKFFVVVEDDAVTVLVSHEVKNYEGPGPKNNVFVIHHWNEALGQWVADVEDVAMLEREQKHAPDAPTMWLNQKAYGAGDVEQLKELLTALVDDFNLSDDAKKFVDQR